MSLITDKAYLLHALRLSHLRIATDPHSSRIISLSPTALSDNPYVRGSGLADVDVWPEIVAALDSPPLEIDKELEREEGKSEDEDDELERARRRRWKGKEAERFQTADIESAPGPAGDGALDPNVSLKYSQTIGRVSRFQPGMQVHRRSDRPTPARGDSSVATSATVTPTARNEPGINNFPSFDALVTPGQTRPLGMDVRRDRMRASTIDETRSVDPAAYSPQTPMASSTTRTPVARALTSVSSRTTPTRQTLTRMTRPRADSAPMLVVSSPSGRDERFPRGPGSPRDAPEDNSQTPTARPRPPPARVRSRRITSMLTQPSSNTPDVAFSPAAISSVLGQPYQEGTGYNANLRSNGQTTDVPPAGADPHTFIMQSQYGSILEQAMMSRSVVTGITENSGMISSSGMGTSYGNGFDQIYEEDEEEDREEIETVADDLDLSGQDRRDGLGRPHHMGAKSILTGMDLAPELSLASMGGLSGVQTRANSEASSVEGDGPVRFSGESARTQIWAGPPTKAQFEKRQIPTSSSQMTSSSPMASGLSMLLKPTQEQGGQMGNPFARYASAPPPQGSSVPTLTLDIYFPFSKDSTKPLSVTVRKDVSVDELIGWALHQYLEEDRSPGLEEGHERGPNRGFDPEVWYSTIGWALRMVEDDGEVDEDFPALDRESQVSKFSFGSFAVVEATPTQIEQSLAKQPLQRSGRATPQIQQPSQLGGSMISPTATPVNNASAAAGPSFSASTLGAPSRNALLNTPAANAYGGLNASVGTAAVGGVIVSLKVRVILASDLQFSTTISVPSEMYFADITEALIRKKNLTPPLPEEWVLVLGDLSMVLPLDRTVESLMGNVQLALVRKEWAQTHGLAVAKANERLGGDPSTSIFKRRSEAPRQSSPRADITSTYKKFIVQRKMPIGRHERILAIDGDYIHIMPTDNKAFFDSMKTSSFHVTSIVTCKQSSKSPTNFKIVVWRDDAEKRYDFEADNARQAAEIISALRALMKLYQSERANLIPSPASRPTRHRLRRH